jgi:lipoyl(octanoyl) transferase
VVELWRFIDTGRGSAAYNMALDEAISLSVKKEAAPPTLRLYGWAAPSVTIGYFQKISEIDVDYCMLNDIPVVRRITGGRAILHADEITYSFSVRTKGQFSGGLIESYRRISAAFHQAFIKAGISPELILNSRTRRLSSQRGVTSPLCFESASYGELTIQGMKVIGSAQKRWSDGLLQQGSIPFFLDREEIGRVFGLTNTTGTMAGLTAIVPDLDAEQFKNAVRLSFEETFNIQWSLSPLSKEELSLAQVLEEKYLSRQWNFRR